MSATVSTSNNDSPERRAAAAHLAGRHRRDRIFVLLCQAATVIGVLLLAALLYGILRDGLGRLSLDFLRNPPSRFAGRAGIMPALYGSLWVVTLTGLVSVPVGVAAAIYLEEYAPKNRLTAFIQTNIANLAGVPSIVYGLLGLAVFVRFLGLQRSITAGALTLALLVLPTVIIATQEALRAVPRSLREASFGLGATQWQTIRFQVLRSAMGGILTGVILSLSRAIGETAPLITIGAASYIAFAPRNLSDNFTVLPVQIFNWAARPQEEFRATAAAAIIVLLAVLLTLNSIALVLRNRFQRQN